MTCIIGLIDKDGDIFMGGDSAGVSGSSLQIRADEKVFINENYIMGITGSFRMGQILRYSFSPPKFYGDIDLYSFMVTTFINKVRKCLKEGGFATKKDEVEKGGKFLVGYKSRLFIIDSDYQVGEMIDKFASIGCGEDIALGSLYSTKNSPLKPEGRIKLALESAEHFNTAVRSPFIILKLERGKNELKTQKTNY